VSTACTTVDEPSGVSRGRAISLAEIDCGPIVSAIKDRRGYTAHAETVAHAAALRASAPHLDIPIADLVKFYGPIAGQGRPTEWWASGNVDIFTRHLLCDPLLHEIVSQHYVAQHTELAL